MSEDMPESFRDHLDRASATVATWPEWKRNLLGKPSRKENVKMSETEKAPWQAAFEKKYRKAYWDRLPETSKQHHKEYYDACIAEHYRSLPKGDEGLAKIHQDALAATRHGWIPWDACTDATTVDSIQAMGAVTAAMRQRGWLEPEEVETLKRDHELTKRNVTFWCERSRESAEVVDAQNARIAELEAEIGRLADQLNEAINDNEDANVEIVPHEVTWREVEEAVKAAQEQHPEGVGVEFDEAFGYWNTRVCVGQEDTPHEQIEDALDHLRKLAEPAPPADPPGFAAWKTSGVQDDPYGHTDWVGWWNNLPQAVRDAFAEVAKGGE